MNTTQVATNSITEPMASDEMKCPRGRFSPTTRNSPSIGSFTPLPYHTPSQEATWRFHWDRGSASPVPRAGVFSDTLTLEGGLMLLIDR